MTDRAADREVDHERELSVDSTSASQRRRDLAAHFTAVLFGSVDDATDTEAQDTSND